jgi:uncharacterized protein YbbC (DUF1343 family)
MKILTVLAILCILWGAVYPASGGTRSSDFKLGNEALLENNLDLLRSKNIGLIINQTSILSDGTYFLDALLSKGINVVKIFSPEHGIRGDETYSEVDSKTGIPIVSLYGGKYKPSSADLKDVDILIYDIQDVGARFYTYTSTLYYVVESAVENSVPLVVCDRPEMINADYVDGFVLNPSFESFVGKIPAPVCYGMTCGELASFLNGRFHSRSDLIIISKMHSYSHGTDYGSLGLEWVKPSPNILTRQSALCYPLACFLEGTNVSEGRGTPKPFEYIGAPWCEGKGFSDELNSYGLRGVIFMPVKFTPSVIISAYPPKYFNEECYGVSVRITGLNDFEPVKAGVAVLVVLKKLFPEFEFKDNNYIDKLAGTDRLRNMINNGSTYNKIIESWEPELKAFIELRKQYLLY